MNTNRNSIIAKLDRRTFLARSAALAGLALTGPNLLLRGRDAASKRLNIAVIGAAGKGQSDRQNVAKDHNIVALVDVDRDRLDSAVAASLKQAQESNPNARPPQAFTDFRKMFDGMAKEIDAVIISTPDHVHFVAAMWALRHGKHVCVQKPLCNTIGEVRRLHDAAKVTRVATQMGNQGRTSEGHRLAKEWIEQGVIGKLQEVRLWTNRPIWPQGPLTKKAAECPASLDWNSWLGPEPDEPYFEFESPQPSKDKKGRRGNAVHPFNWRGWWQFGAGALGDMGCHIMDAAFNVLGQRQPVKIEVSSSPVTDLTAPEWSQLVYHLPAKGKFPALKVTWHDGSKDGRANKPERDQRVSAEAFNRDSSGMMFIGTDAVIYADTYCNRPTIFPEAKDDEVREAMSTGKIKKTEPRSRHAGNSQLEWASCIVEGGKPSSNFDYAAPLSEFVLLGNLAIRSGQTIEWNAARGKVSNLKSANRFIERPAYRPGWV
jgi:predicted dehydrogenase